MGTMLALDFAKKAITAVEGSTVDGLYTDLLTDTLYAIEGTTVLPQFAGSALTAVWRSKRFVIDAQPSFAWAKLDGPFSGAVLKLYGNGSLYYTTPTITNNNPVRLPAKRFREIEIQVESDDRLTELTLASSVAELR